MGVAYVADSFEDGVLNRKIWKDKQIKPHQISFSDDSADGNKSIVITDGEDVLISGFGKFCVHQKSERRGRNPATGEEMMLKPRKVVTFKCSGKLRDRCNGRCD